MQQPKGGRGKTLILELENPSPSLPLSPSIPSGENPPPLPPMFPPPFLPPFLSSFPEMCATTTNAASAQPKSVVFFSYLSFSVYVENQDVRRRPLPLLFFLPFFAALPSLTKQASL